MHIVDMTYFWARTMPQHQAVIQPEGVLTYRALALGIESAAEYFLGNIPDKSKLVTVSVSTPPKMLIASLGLLRAGYSIIVAAPKDLAHLPSADSDTLVYEHGGTPLSDRTNIAFDESWLEIGAAAPRHNRPLPQPRTSNANIYFFSSGTTGKPKRVVRTQRAWDERVLIRVSSAFDNFERVLLLAGLSSSMGFSGAYEALHGGKTLCFAPPGQPMLWLANTYDIDLIMASPQQALALAELQEKVTRYPLAALKTIRIGGSVLSAAGLQRIKNNLCRNVVLTYGSTETGTAAIAPHDTVAHIPSAVGFLTPGTEVEIVNVDGKILPVGSEGFVRLRTAQFLANLQAADSNTWFYSGDVGWLTEEGVLCIAGRKGDVLNRGGVNLSVTDFEDFLRSCPGVMDAGVCTVMGASGFEEVWIGLVLEPSADIGMLREKIESNTEFGTNIDKLFAVESIPRGTVGKIQRGELKKILQSIAEEADAPQ
jgi:acyl-coenzyme A synthetase/AMP-(fatty) acid ligase